MYLSLTGDSGSSDNDAVHIEDDGEKNRDEDDDYNDDDGQDSDASGPISSNLMDLSGGCFVTGEGEGINSGSLKNDTYLLSEDKQWSEDPEVSDSDIVAPLSDNEVSTEKCQEQSIDSFQSKRRDSKIGICNTTFVIDKSKSSSSMTHPELSHIYKKPVSVVHPLTSSELKQSAKTTLSKDDHVNSFETSGKLDLAQAVLCSRNKIALALAEIVEGKQPSVMSDDSTCHADGETEVTSSGEESCSTYPRSLDSYCRFRETCVHVGKKDKCDLMGKEQTKASVIRGPHNAFASQESKVRDLETRQPFCSNADKQHRFVRRRSLKIAPSFLDLETKSSPQSVKLENGKFDMPRVNSSPSKRRGAILCKLGGPMKCKGQSTYLEWCSADSPIMCPSSKALGTPLDHQRSAALCNLRGPVPCSGQGTYLESCSDDSLNMCPGSKAPSTPSGHQRSATLCNSGGPVICNGLGKYLERCPEDSLVMCPGSKALGTPSGRQRSAGPATCNGQSTDFERCSEDSPIMSPGSKALGTPSGHSTTPLFPRSMSSVLQSSSSNSKRRRSSQVLRVLNDAAAIDSWSSVETKAACFEHRKETLGTSFEKGDHLPKTCRSTAKLTSSTSSPDELARVNYSKRSLFFSNVAPDFSSSYQKSIGEDVFKEKWESSSPAVKSRKDQKLSCSKTYRDLVNAQTRGKFPSSIALRKNSCDSRGYVFDTQEEGDALNVKNETADEQAVDKLNCGRNLLASNLFKARSDIAQLSAADRAGVQSKERVIKSSKKHAFSPSRSSRNSHLPGGLGSETADEQTVDKLNCGRNLLDSNLFKARSDIEQLSAADRAGVQSKERVMKSSKKHAFSPSGSSRNSHLAGGLGSDTSPLKSIARKKRARESVAQDALESLPSKHAKKGSSCSNFLELCPLQNSSSSQALRCYRKESTPMKKTNLESARLERFMRQNAKPLSPIRPTPADPGGSVNNAAVSPCKVLGSCDKSFCFDCC